MTSRAVLITWVTTLVSRKNRDHKLSGKRKNYVYELIACVELWFCLGYLIEKLGRLRDEPTISKLPGGGRLSKII